jgi:hypothetical protein
MKQLGLEIPGPDDVAIVLDEVPTDRPLRRNPR